MSSALLEADAAVAPAVPTVSVERATLLVVDDSQFDRRLVADLLAPLQNLNVVYAGSVSAGLSAIARESPAVVLTDLVLPDGEGLELVERIRATAPANPCDSHDSLWQRGSRHASASRRGGQLHRQEAPGG